MRQLLERRKEERKKDERKGGGGEGGRERKGRKEGKLKLVRTFQKVVSPHHSRSLQFLTVLVS